MIPILYPHTETAFTSEGLGRLVDCTSCVVKEERNGVYECTFGYPVNGHGYDRIQEGCYILVPHDGTGDLQPFEISMRSEPLFGITTFQCKHISYQLGNVIVAPFTALTLRLAVQGITNNIYGTTGFTFSTDIWDANGYYELQVPKPAKQVLTEILDAFKVGEVLWNKLVVNVYARRGADNVASVVYGKNLSKLQRDTDYSTAFNAIVPYWKGQDGTCVSPGIIRSNHDIHVPGDVVPQVVDFSSMYDEVPTQQEFQDSATRYFQLNTPWIPTESIDFDFVALEKMGEYEDYGFLQSVSLCDTITVYFPDQSTTVTEKVVSVEYDVLLEQYNKITVGKKRDTYSDLIKDSIRRGI